MDDRSVPYGAPPPGQPDRPGNDEAPASPRNERAFAILAPPDRIWRTLLEEVQLGVESGRVEIVRQVAPRTILLDVRIGWGLAVRYDYRLSHGPEHAPESPVTEVAVAVTPYGFRHAMANIITFGRALTPHMLAVTQGLANLKQAVEADSPPGR